MSSKASKAPSKAVTSSKADAAILKAVDTAAVEWNSGVASQAEKARLCATATFLAFQAGYVGVGKQFGTGREYAARFLSPNGGVDPKTGEARTVGQTTVIMWRRVGKALDQGADETTIKRLFDGAALDGRIGKALDESKSATATRKAVNSIYGRNGKVLPKSTTDNGSNTGGETDQSETEAERTTAPAMPRNNSGRLDLIEQALASLKSVGKADKVRLSEIVERIGEITGVAYVVAPATAVESPMEGVEVDRVA